MPITVTTTTPPTTTKATVANKPALHHTSLRAGMPAPFFEGINQQGQLISLRSFTGRRLLLYFYPKDNTPPCTAQACNLRDHYSELGKNGISIVGVSADNELSHAEFSDKHQLPFSILADTDLAIIKAYDVWGMKDIAGRFFEGIVRTSFLIDEHGIIERVINNVSTSKHADQILNS